MFDQPHRRWNPLTGEPVLVSAKRTARPWQGKVETVPESQRPFYDPTCYLCPGNPRANGTHNPHYGGTHVFENDFAALRPRAPEETAWSTKGLFQAQAEAGLCRVVCFSPRHDLSLPLLSIPDLEAVLHTWTEESRSLASREDIQYVQIFENKGEMMGCSNPHPHSQIWATEHVPTEPLKELDHQRAYFQAHGRPLLMDYLQEELRRQERLVLEGDHFVAVVPFWAQWPFETLLLPRRSMATLPDLTLSERRSLAEVLKRLTTRYDNLFDISFPYSMGLHQAPCEGVEHPEWVFHLHFYPPLLRSATVRKFMVGFEMLGMPGRDILPEEAAARLRACAELHHTLR